MYHFDVIILLLKFIAMMVVIYYKVLKQKQKYSIFPFNKYNGYYRSRLYISNRVTNIFPHWFLFCLTLWEFLPITSLIISEAFGEINNSSLYSRSTQFLQINS